MSPIIFSPDVTRANYNRVRELIKRETGSADNFIINQSVLRIEQALSPTRNKYEFDLYENSGSDRPLERKLNRNDMFVVTHIALGITKQDATNGDYAFPVYTYPEPTVFGSGTTMNNAEAKNLETIFTGQLTLLTKPVERLEGFLTSLLKFKPSEAGSEQFGSLDFRQPSQFGPSAEEKGYFGLTPNVVLDGNENNKVELTLGQGPIVNIDGNLNETGLTNVLVLRLMGFEVQNAAQKAQRWSAY